MHRLSFLLLLSLAFTVTYGQSKKKTAPAQKEYIELRVYHAADSQQVQTIEQYLQTTFLPRLERKGFDRVGVFTAWNNDTASDKRVYVLIPFAALSQLEQLNSLADESQKDSSEAGAYTRAAYNHPSYLRFETIVLQAFAGMPGVKPSALKGNQAERVYELRSYESATEALHLNKVQMFNSGEINLFQRLGFNAVFYGRVMAGSRMPNLMYMTSFENRTSRNDHWKTFGQDPEWKDLSSRAEYQHNVSKSEIIYLKLASYSRLK